MFTCLSRQTSLCFSCNFTAHDLLSIYYSHSPFWNRLQISFECRVKGLGEYLSGTEYMRNAAFFQIGIVCRSMQPFEGGDMLHVCTIPVIISVPNILNYSSVWVWYAFTSIKWLLHKTRYSLLSRSNIFVGINSVSFLWNLNFIE